MNNKLLALIEFLSMSNNHTDEVFDKFSTIEGVVVCGFGMEKYCYIEGTRENKVLLVAHADTVWDQLYRSKIGNSIKKVVYRDGVFRNLYGGLGADDRAGCAMVYLLKELGHSILIVNGEEAYCLAAERISKSYLGKQLNKKHQFIIELDRKGVYQYKTYGVGSSEFENYIKASSEFKFYKPNNSAFTDIVFLANTICGVNLSVGFHEEHTQNEYLVYHEWLKTYEFLEKLLKHKNLPKFELNCKFSFDYNCTNGDLGV